MILIYQEYNFLPRMRERFLLPSPFHFSLSRDGNNFRRERSFLLPSSAPFSPPSSPAFFLSASSPFLSLARARAHMHARSLSQRKLFLSQEEPLVPSLPLPLLPLSLTRGHARGGGGNLASSTSSALFSSCGPARETLSLHLPISFFREEREERRERREKRDERAEGI